MDSKKTRALWGHTKKSKKVPSNLSRKKRANGQNKKTRGQRPQFKISILAPSIYIRLLRARSKKWGGGSIFQTKALKTKFLKISKCCSKSEGGQFYKRNPFERIFWKHQNFAQKFLTEDPILLGTKFKKSRSLEGFFFCGSNSPTCREY